MIHKKIIAKLLHRHSGVSRNKARLIRRVSDKLGFVYFGHVDQHKDDHEVVRGFTASTSHEDRHYAVGTFEGYDIAIVDRNDTSRHTGDIHEWMILQINLKEAAHIPHVFLEPIGTRHDAFRQFSDTTFHVSVCNHLLEDYSMDLKSRFNIHVAPAKTQELELSLRPSVAQVIAARFWPHAIEIWDGKLFVYITENRLTETVVLSSLQSAVWLADQLEAND